MTTDYEIDWDKIQTLEDIKVVLRAFNITLAFITTDVPVNFKEIYEKGFLKIKS